MVAARGRGKWTEQQMMDAVEMVSDNLISIREASRRSGIPESSIRDWLYGRTTHKQQNSPTVLTSDQEKELEEWALDRAQRGLAVTLDELRERAGELCGSGVPGYKWWRLFKGRHPNVSLRSTEPLEVSRAKAMNESNLRYWYVTLHELYMQFNFPPSRIWNADEVGIQAGKLSGMKILAQRGVRNVHEVVMQNTEWVTTLVCVNAEGHKLPSFYIFKRARLRDDCIARCEEGAIMAVQPQAWMTSQLFHSWLDHFSKRVPGGVSPEQPHLLIMDGHKSRVDLEVILAAKERGLHFAIFPAHTSHALQPLDVSCFGPFKIAFRKLRARYMLGRGKVEPKREDIAAMISEAATKSLTPLNIISGFRATGIWPFVHMKVTPLAVATKFQKYNAVNHVQNQPLDEDDPIHNQALEEEDCAFVDKKQSNDDEAIEAKPIHNDYIKYHPVKTQAWIDTPMRQEGNIGMDMAKQEPNNDIFIVGPSIAAPQMHGQMLGEGPIPNDLNMGSHEHTSTTCMAGPSAAALQMQEGRPILLATSSAFPNLSQPTIRQALNMEGNRMIAPDLRGKVHVTSDEFCHLLIKEKARRDLEIRLRYERIATKKMEQQRKKAEKIEAMKRAHERREEREANKKAHMELEASTRRLRHQLYPQGKSRVAEIFGQQRPLNMEAKQRRLIARNRLRSRQGLPLLEMHGNVEGGVNLREDYDRNSSCNVKEEMDKLPENDAIFTVHDEEESQFEDALDRWGT